MVPLATLRDVLGIIQVHDKNTYQSTISAPLPGDSISVKVWACEKATISGDVLGDVHWNIAPKKDICFPIWSFIFESRVTFQEGYHHCN